MPNNVTEYSFERVAQAFNNFYHEGGPGATNQVMDTQSPIYKLADRIHPDARDELTRVLMHKALYTNTGFSKVRKRSSGKSPFEADVAVNNQNRVFSFLNTAKVFLEDKLGQATVYALEKKQLGLLYKLLQYSTEQNVRITPAYLDELFDTAIRKKDFPNYRFVLEYKMEHDAKALEQAMKKGLNVDKLSQKQIETSSKRFNQDLITLLNSKDPSSFSDLVEIIATYPQQYDLSLDKAGYYNVRSLFDLRFPNITTEVKDELMGILLQDKNDLPESKTELQQSTQAINKAVIDNLENNTVSALIYLGKTCSDEISNYYDASLDPHAFALMNAKLKTVEASNKYDTNLMLGTKDHLQSIVDYHLRNKKETTSDLLAQFNRNLFD